MDDFPFLSERDPLAKIKVHHGSIAGMEQRSDFIECLKIWCVPSFLDAYCYTILISPDGRKCFLRKLLWRLFSQKPDRPFETALETEIPVEFADRLMDELGRIEMKPFWISSDQILDAAQIGLTFARGDVRVDLSWTGGFEGSYKALENWMDAAERSFDQYFPRDPAT